MATFWMKSVASIITLLSPSAIFADPICDDLWFSRNFYFDRAGYCFSSVLGEEIFDNSDCSTDAPDLTVAEKSVISEIQEQEQFIGCNVDILQRRELDMEHFNQRLTLDDQPLRSEFESACIGYLGEPLDLHSGRNDESTVTGQIEQGDSILLYHATPTAELNKQTFISGVVKNNNLSQAIGWTSKILREKDCAEIAG